MTLRRIGAEVESRLRIVPLLVAVAAALLLAGCGREGDAWSPSEDVNEQTAGASAAVTPDAEGYVPAGLVTPFATLAAGIAQASTAEAESSARTNAFPTATPAAFFKPAAIPTLSIATAAPAATPFAPAATPVAPGNSPAAGAVGAGTPALLCGRIEQLPSGGLVGDWRVGGRTVRVSDETRTDAQEGQYEFGWYAQVRGWAQGDGSLHAERIDVKKPDNNDRCQPGLFVGAWDDDGNRDGDDDQDGDKDKTDKDKKEKGKDKDKDDKDDDKEAKIEGMVQQLPANGLVGTWVIDGRQIVVSADTKVKIESNAGRLGSGTRVKVEGYWGDDGRLYAKEMESKD